MGTLVFQATLGGAVNIIGPNIATTINFTLPSADGTSGQTWTTNGSGLLTFGTLGVAGGGTGLTTLATGSLSYGAGTSAFSALAIGTAGQVLTVNSGATAPQWSTLTGVAVTTFSAGTTGFTPSSATSGAVTLAGTLGIANGGTGQTTANAALNALLPTQTSNASKYLQTDGTNSSWDAISLSTADITGTLGTANGGTGLTSFTSGGAVYATSTSALTTGTLPVASGGTGLTTLTTGYIPFGAGTSAFGNSANLFWDNTNGRLGIGIASPSTSLTIASSSARILIQPGTTTNSAFTQFNSTAGNAYVGLDSSSGGLGGAAYGLSLWHAGAYPIVFGTNNTERARIDASGNVMVGTTSPIFNTSGRGTVNVNGTTDAVISLSAGGTTATAAYLLYDGTNTTIQTVSNGYTRFGTNNAERMRLDNVGNLGLGVTPSAANLPTIQSSYGIFTGNSQVNITANAYYNGGWKYYATGVQATRYSQLGASSHVWEIAAAGTAGGTISFTQAMTLTETGRLGIGTTSPSALVHAVGASGTNCYYQIAQTSVESWTMGMASSSSALAFANSGTERARIDSSGNLLVGLTSATGVAKLQVSGALKTTGFTVATLPTGTVGMRTYVTDALAPTFGATVVTGGAVTIPVFYNGTNWIVC